MGFEPPTSPIRGENINRFTTQALFIVCLLTVASTEGMKGGEKEGEGKEELIDCFLSFFGHNLKWHILYTILNKTSLSV